MLTKRGIQRAGAPARKVAAVTPSATALDPACDALLITTAGNLAFTAVDGGNSGTFAVTAGQVIPVSCSHVLAATTAVVLALYH